MTRRRVGAVLAGLGILVAAYAVTVLLWRDPATDLYARWKQHTLSEELDQTFAEERGMFASLQIRDENATQTSAKFERIGLEQLAVARGRERAPREAQAGEGAGPAEGPAAGVEHGLRARNALGARPLPGPRALSADISSRRRQDDGHRRAPDDLRRPVPAHRLAAQGRLDHGRAPVRDLPLPRVPSRDRRQRGLEHHPRPRLRHAGALRLPSALQRGAALGRLRAPRPGRSRRRDPASDGTGPGRPDGAICVLGASVAPQTSPPASTRTARTALS